MVYHLYFSLNLMLEYTLTLDLAFSGTRRPEIIGESGGNSGVYLVSFRLCNHYSLLKTTIWSL